MADTTTYSDVDFSPVDGSTVAAPAVASTSPVSYSDADFSPLPTDTTSVAPAKGYTGPDSTLTNIGEALKSVPATDWQATKDYYSQAGSDMADTMQGVHDYFSNFHANHQVQPSRPVTPEEISAMEAQGISPQQAMTDGNLILDFNSPTKYSFAPTYKTTPGEDLSSAGDADKHRTVPGYFLNQSFPSKLIQGIASPHLATTKFLQTVQDTIQQQRIVANPSKYSPAQVAQAKQTLTEYKQQAAMTTLQKVKEGIHAIAQNPGDMITSLLGDPTMWFAGEAKWGTLAYGNDIEKASQAAKTAQDIADSARKIKEYALVNNVKNKAAVIAKADRYIKRYGDFAEKASTNVKRLSRLSKGGDVAGAAASGAAINSVLSQQQQLSEQGFTNPKDTQATGITGATFGGVLGGLGALGGEGEIPKTHPDTVDGTPPAKGPVTAREPGQPLPSTTPVDATKVVPYYGGVDAQGNVIHISKDTPTHIEMKDKTGNPVKVPVRQTVAYHESVEHPLMHLTGPVSDAQMQLIKERMGPYAHMPAEVEAKLREGKALSYGEAHDIATRSENHLVESMYGVDHNTYQDALKPHIAKVAKDSASAKAEDIPANLDTKPYDNMGHPEQLHGQGDRPAQDAGQPGAGTPGSPEINGFLHGPEPGDRYRVGASSAMGGALSLETESANGRPRRTNYIGVDGELIPADKINLANHAEPGEGRDQLWIPDTPEKAAQAKAILDELGRTGPAGDGYVDLLDRLHELVTGNSPEMPGNGSVGIDNANTPISDKDISPITREQPAPSGETNPQLPQHLRGAKPWYSFGSKRFQLQFDNDLDKASYIAAGSTLSKRDAEYVKFVMDHLGLTEAEVRARGKEIKNRIKAEAKDKEIPAGKKAGVINVRHLAAAGLTLGAAGYGAYQAGPGHRTEGTFKGLFGGMTMFGHQAIFGGALADTFNPARAAEAIRMKGEGKTPEQINFKTGMHEGAGGHWYHEISDHNASIQEDNVYGNTIIAKHLRQEGVPLDNILTAPEMEKAYPGLLHKIHIRIDPKVRGGSYDPHTGNITVGPPIHFPASGKDTFVKIILHEVNHAVQHYEGQPRGDSSKTHVNYLKQHVEDLDRQLTDVTSRLHEAFQDGNDRYIESLTKEQKELDDKLAKLTPEKINQIAKDRYHRSAGENMSVAVQERADLSPEQRRMQVPKTEYSNEEQRVKYNNEPSPHLTGVLNHAGEGVAAHEMSISEHLQKTGEMDEEGKLSGMVLPEDKLPNENEVLAKAAQNDQGAISKLYKQYMPRLIRNARGLMRTAGPRLGMDAEDLAMQVFHKAILHLKSGSFNGDSSFYTWMHSILRNTGLNEISRSGRTVPTESIHGATHDAFGSPVSDIKPAVRNIDAGEGTPEDNMIARQTSNMVQHAISKLPQDIREAVKAYEMEGKSYEEIANEQGVPVGTVRSRLNRGRDMIEQSIKRGHGANFRKQGGFVDPALRKALGKLAYTATIGTIGAYIGNQVGSDHSLKDSLIGAGIAIVAGPLIHDLTLHPVKSAKTILGGIKGLSVTPVKEDIIGMTSRWQGARLKAEVGIYRMVKGINALAPSKESRIRINSVMDGDTSIRLTPEEHKAMIVARAFDDEIGKFGLSEGILKELIGNHISHLWKQSEALDKYKEEINATLSSPMSTKSVFAISRKVKSIAEGKARGLEPVTEDVSEVLSTYAKSMLAAIRNKQLIDSLKNTKPSEGEGTYIMPRNKAPANYVSINHPALRNSVVHPSIAGEMRQIFYSYDLGDISSILSTINMGVKRSNVSFSAFHLTSLVDAVMGGLPTFTHPIQTLKTVIGSPFGKSVYHTALMDKADPATQQLFDRFLNSGAVPQIPKGAAADMDVANNYYEGLKQVQNYLDRAMPYGGKIPEALGVLSHAMDHVIFENGMSAMKFAVWMHSVDKISSSYAKMVAKDPSFKVPSQDEIDRMASGFANNLGGGQNWLQAAQDATTKIGKAYLTALGSPIGRKISQYLLFAPDWTTSTVMSLTKALGKGSEQFGTGPISNALAALDGLRNPKTVADLHRIYQIRSAALYMLLGNIVNLAYSGHPIWENKDKTTIDMGNGQRMQWNKHWMEPAQLAIQFPQAEVDKLGIIPKELLEQTFDKQYLSVKKYAPPIHGRIKHLFTSAAPIPFQDLSNATPTQLLWNILGRNVIGHPPEIEREIKMRNKQEALKEKMAKLSGGQ